MRRTCFITAETGQLPCWAKRGPRRFAAESACPPVGRCRTIRRDRSRNPRYAHNATVRRRAPSIVERSPTSERKLSFSSTGTRVGLIFRFKAFVPLNSLQLQNLIAAKPRGQTLGCDRQAGMQENAAHWLGTLSAVLRRSAPARQVNDPDSGWILPGERKLRGVVENQKGRVRGGKTALGSLQVPGENRLLH